MLHVPKEDREDEITCAHGRFIAMYHLNPPVVFTGRLTSSFAGQESGRLLAVHLWSVRHTYSPPPLDLAKDLFSYPVELQEGTSAL